jgi:hypothetical protein
VLWHWFIGMDLNVIDYLKLRIKPIYMGLDHSNRADIHFPKAFF